MRNRVCNDCGQLHYWGFHHFGTSLCSLCYRLWVEAVAVDEALRALRINPRGLRMLSKKKEYMVDRVSSITEALGKN